MREVLSRGPMDVDPSRGSASSVVMGRIRRAREFDMLLDGRAQGKLASLSKRLETFVRESAPQRSMRSAGIAGGIHGGVETRRF